MRAACTNMLLKQSFVTPGNVQMLNMDMGIHATKMAKVVQGPYHTWVCVLSVTCQAEKDLQLLYRV